MKKNDIVRLTISSITSEGNGVGRYNGMAVFVPFTAVGDVLDCRIVKVQNSFCYGKVENLVISGASRMKPDCPHYCKCGGCNMRHMTYSAELEAKQGFVRDAFTRIGGFEMLPEPIAAAPERIRYRNKVQLPICKQDDTMRFGFFSPRSHRVVPLDDCLIQPKNFTDIAEYVCKYNDENGISEYDEQTGRGLLRHIYIRQGYYSKQLMLCLVVTHKTDVYNDLVTRILMDFPEIETVILNINPKQTNVILGEENVVLFGNGNISDTMCGNTVTISPHSFYQINTPAAENVYKIAAEYANLKGNEILVDLYCGAGTFGLSVADKISKLIGVEIIPQAVENAKQNSKTNGVSNAEFICGDAGTIADELAKRGTAPDVIIVDPPRKGCDKKTLDAVLTMNPERFVMISCNPATAARDCKYMCEHSYRLVKYRPADLFPGTSHVETVCLLSKLQNRQHIEIELNMDELDVTDAEKKATYPEIKEYVMEHYGYKIPSLYIAQVKQKCGIIERENYNKSKYEHPRQAKCPSEKRGYHGSSATLWDDLRGIDDGELGYTPKDMTLVSHWEYEEK